MTTVTRSERVEAPREIVWQQLGLTPALFETLPAADATVSPDGTSAVLTVRLGIGPVAMKRSGSLHIAEARAPERMVLEGRLDNDAIRWTGVLALAVSAEDETQLTYQASAETQHAMPRLGRILATLIDDHATDFIKQIADAAGRHWKAEQALGKR